MIFHLFFCIIHLMRIIGIDPGMAIVGYSIIETNGDKIELVTSGSIQTDKDLPESKRLKEIYNDLSFLINKYKPEEASIEKLYFFKNQKTVMPVSQARGVILLALENNGIIIHEYTPIQIKQTLTGYGRASKDEVAKYVEVSLAGQKIPKLDDTVDSIAIAVCHLRNLVYS